MHRPAILRRTVRIVALLALIGTAAFPAAALAASPVNSLPGTYKTKVTRLGPLNGTWTITFSKFTKSRGRTHFGSYKLLHRRTVEERGPYKVKGSKLTFLDDLIPFGCSGPEDYGWSLTGNKLGFGVLSSPFCAGRVQILRNTFTRVK
jgi:hypothetical protein